MHERRSARVINERLQVIDLPVDGIGEGVGAGSFSAAVIGEGCEVLRQRLGQLRHRTEPAEITCGVHQYHRRAAAHALECDGRAITGRDSADFHAGHRRNLLVGIVLGVRDRVAGGHAWVPSPGLARSQAGDARPISGLQVQGCLV